MDRLSAKCSVCAVSAEDYDEYDFAADTSTVVPTDTSSSTPLPTSSSPPVSTTPSPPSSSTPTPIPAPSDPAVQRYTLNDGTTNKTCFNMTAVFTVLIQNVSLIMFSLGWAWV